MSALRLWERAAQEEIREIAERIGPLEAQRNAAFERLELIRRLMKLHETADSVESGEAQEAVLKSSVGATDLEGEVERLLEQTGEPMHISVVRQALLDRGVPLPGRGDEANIIVRLRRLPERFTRTGRGTYGLARWGIPEATPVQRKRVARKRKTAR